MRVVMIADDVEVDRRIIQEAQTLSDRGDEVILLARRGDGQAPFERIGAVKLERLDIPVDGRRERAVRRLFARLTPRRDIGAGVDRALDRACSLAVKAVRRTRRQPYRDAVLADRVAFYRPDVVHAHDLPQLRAAFSASDRLGVPLVYDAHELYPEIGSLPARLRRRLARLERTLAPKCDVILTVNPYIADEFARRYRIERPTVILNAIDPGMASGPGGADLRRALGLDASARVVLYQGWIARSRGLELLIEALAHTAPEVHLVLLGYGEFADTLNEIARVRGQQQRTHVLPAVAQSELLDWTRSADVGVIPYPDVDLNHHWCSPNKLFEFIQAGIPIVANDLPYLRDVIVGEQLGRVAPIERPEEFAAALEDVLSPDRRAEFARMVRDAAPRYDWSSQVPALLGAYDAVAPSPKANG